MSLLYARNSSNCFIIHEKLHALDITFTPLCLQQNGDTVGSSTFFKVAQLKRGNMASEFTFIYTCSGKDFSSSFPSLPSNTKQEQQKSNKQICYKKIFSKIFFSRSFSPLRISIDESPSSFEKSSKSQLCLKVNQHKKAKPTFIV